MPFLPTQGYWLPPLSTEDRDRKWHNLESSFFRFTNADEIALMSFEELYRTAHELVSKGCGEFVYQQVTLTLSKLCQQTIQHLADTPQDQFVYEFTRLYSSYKAAAGNIADVLLYLDKNYAQPRSLPSVKTQAGLQFRLELFEKSSVGQRVCETLQHFVEKLRQATADRPLSLDQMKTLVPEAELRKIVSSTLVFESPDQKFLFYKKAIQEPLGESSLRYFKDDFANNLDRIQSGRQLLNHIWLRLAMEPLILKACGILERPTIAHQVQLIMFVYVDELHPKLFASPELDLKQLFSSNSDVGKQLYVVVKGCPAAFQTFITKMRLLLESEVKATLNYPTAIKCVEALTQLRHKYAQYVTDHFDNSSDLAQLITKAIRNVSRVSGLLCRKLAGSVNETLLMLECGRNANRSPDRIESFIREHVLEPFRALQDHDMFEFAYRNQLIGRLLDVLSRWYVDGETDSWGESVWALENEALKPFIDECGQFYVKKVRGFFDDIELSQDFHQMHNKQTGGLRVVVVSLTQWMQELKQTPTFDFTHVPELSRWKDAFEQHYQSHFAHRKLRWLLEHGKGLVRFNVGDPRCMSVDICASTIQLAILLLFNHHPELTWRQICQMLNIDSPVATRHWIGLWAREETAVLIPMDTKLKKSQLTTEDTVPFTINFKFHTDKKRITASVVSSKAKALRPAPVQETASDEMVSHAESTVEELDMPLAPSGLPYSLEQDRKSMVEAAIVRVLKAHRSMNHSSLVSAINQSLVKRGFLPSPAFVKDRLEELMARDFIARDANDLKLYHYIS